DELQRGLDQLLACEWIADLHGRTFVRIVLAELGAREYRGAADPVSAGGRTEQDDVRADRGRACARHPVSREEADAHRVDEAIVAVGLVEHGLAAHGRDADAVPVVPDARNRLAEVMVRRGEAEPIED